MRMDDLAPLKAGTVPSKRGRRTLSVRIRLCVLSRLCGENSLKRYHEKFQVLKLVIKAATCARLDIIKATIGY